MNVYKLTFLLTFFFLQCTLTLAQQQTQYSMGFLNPYSLNPAVAGSQDALEFNAHLRMQWLGITGNPQYQMLNAHLPWYYASGALGIKIENDQLGAERSVKGYFSYAYRHTIAKKWTLAAGVDVGIIQRSIDGSMLIAPDQDNTDFSIPQSTVNAFAPDINLGIFVKHPSIELGAAFQHITSPNSTIVLTQKTISIKNQAVLLAHTRGNLALSSNFNLYPAVVFKSNLSQHQLEYNLSIMYQKFISLGFSYRGYNNTTQDAVIMNVDVQLSNALRLAYSYDLTLSPLNAASQGSHELLVTYRINKKIGGAVPQKIINNTRFL